MAHSTTSLETFTRQLPPRLALSVNIGLAAGKGGHLLHMMVMFAIILITRGQTPEWRSYNVRKAREEEPSAVLPLPCNPEAAASFTCIGSDSTRGRCRPQKYPGFCGPDLSPIRPIHPDTAGALNRAGRLTIEIDALVDSDESS